MLTKSKGLKSNEIDMTKFDISLFTGILAEEAKKIIPKVFKSIQKAKTIYRREIKTIPNEISPAPKEFWEEVSKKAKTLGIDLIGFAPVDEDLIFIKDHVGGIELLYANAIVLGMEMDFNAIKQAPGPQAGLESLRIYAELGTATNLLTSFIQSKGYRAIACHPLGGPILYPAMAVKAKLGEIGRQGLLITKKFGPRQRLSMISINVGPLPDNNIPKIDIASYCEKCRRCLSSCPVGAIYDTPIINKNGTTTRINSDKCFNYFYKTVGCSICIETCPFHRIGYNLN